MCEAQGRGRRNNETADASEGHEARGGAAKDGDSQGRQRLRRVSRASRGPGGAFAEREEGGEGKGEGERESGGFPAKKKVSLLGNPPRSSV